LLTSWLRRAELEGKSDEAKKLEAGRVVGAGDSWTWFLEAGTRTDLRCSAGQI